MSIGLIGSLKQLFNCAIIILCHHLSPGGARGALTIECPLNLWNNLRYEMERLVLPLLPDYPPLAAFLARREEMKGGFGPAIVKKHGIFRLDGLISLQGRKWVPSSVRRHKLNECGSFVRLRQNGKWLWFCWKVCWKRPKVLLHETFFFFCGSSPPLSSWNTTECSSHTHFYQRAASWFPHAAGYQTPGRDRTGSSQLKGRASLPGLRFNSRVTFF